MRSLVSTTISLISGLLVATACGGSDDRQAAASGTGGTATSGAGGGPDAGSRGGPDGGDRRRIDGSRGGPDGGDRSGVDATSGSGGTTGVGSPEAGMSEDAEPPPDEVWRDLRYKLLSPGGDYDGDVEQTVRGDLAAVAASWASDGYVVTAAVTNQAPYTLFAMRTGDGSRRYETNVMESVGPELQQNASAMAAQGYVVTAATPVVPYVLFGTREVGSDRQYEARVEQTDMDGLEGTVNGFARDGYVVTAVARNTVPYSVFGVREIDSPYEYEVQVTSAFTPDLDSRLSSLGATGYLVTAVVPELGTSRAGGALEPLYELIAYRRIGDTATYAAGFRQSIGPELDAAMVAMIGDGYFVAAATANDVPYTLFGFVSE